MLTKAEDELNKKYYAEIVVTIRKWWEFWK